MDPTSPVIAPEFSDREVVYAKDQPGYRPLPVHRTDDGMVLSRWHFTHEERLAVSQGADVYLYQWTGNRPLQPVAVTVSDPLVAAKRIGLIKEEVEV